MESTMPSTSELQDNSAANGNAYAKSLSLLKKMDKNKPWMKEYVTDIGVLLLKETRKGNVDKVVDLLCKGAPCITDSTGVSPLHFAAYNNSVEIVELLLNGGMMKDSKNKVDRTALHIASQKGHSNIVKMLLSYGSDPDIVDMMNMSALHWAVEGGHIECVQFLLKYGASIGKADNFGRTPLDIAADNNLEDILSLLKNKQATLFCIPEVFIGNIMENEKQGYHKNEIEESTAKFSTTIDKSESVEKETPNIQPPFFRSKISPQRSYDEHSYIRADNDTLQLLKEHGIQMLEPDKVTTIHSAVESGQQVVLTEAGKLALDCVSKKMPVNFSFPPMKRSGDRMVIVQNGQKSIKINTGRLTSFNLDKDKSFFRNVTPSSSVRTFEGRIFTEKEDNLLKTKLQTKINKLRHEAKILDIFAKRKFRQANLYQEQLLSLLHLKEITDIGKVNST